MKARVEGYLDNLNDICRADPALRRAIICKAPPEVVEALSEICFNYIKGNINCSAKQYKTLNCHRLILRKISEAYRGRERDRKNRKFTDKYLKNINSKKKLLLQVKGGF